MSDFDVLIKFCFPQFEPVSDSEEEVRRNPKMMKTSNALNDSDMP